MRIHEEGAMPVYTRPSPRRTPGSIVQPAAAEVCGAMGPGLRRDDSRGVAEKRAQRMKVIKFLSIALATLITQPALALQTKSYAVAWLQLATYSQDGDCAAV